MALPSGAVMRFAKVTLHWGETKTPAVSNLVFLSTYTNITFANQFIPGLARTEYHRKTYTKA